MKFPTQQHQANCGILRLAAHAIRQQLRELSWFPQLGNCAEDCASAGRALAAFADRLERAAATGSPNHVQLLLGEAGAAVVLPVMPPQEAA